MTLGEVMIGLFFFHRVGIDMNHNVRHRGKLMKHFVPDIFGDSRLKEAWIFKCDSRMKALDTHADFAAVNVNIWLTPDAAAVRIHPTQSTGLNNWKNNRVRIESGSASCARPV